ncbi:MAG TPA: GntR family transcriptional regulator [Longimicrobiales bacterium]
MSIISREPLRTEVRRVLLMRLLSGELEPGSRINESKLAEELGVSRTPLREALIHLEFEGFIESVQGKGFSVAPLRPKTARDLHAFVGLLEGIAMRSLANLTPEQLSRLVDELERINRELAVESKDPGRQDLETVIQLGDEWHGLLVSACDNEQILEILRLLKQRLYRYTYSFVRQAQRVEITLGWHEEIIEALRRREIDRAIELVHQHWMTGADARYEWLREAE